MNVHHVPVDGHSLRYKLPRYRLQAPVPGTLADPNGDREVLGDSMRPFGTHSDSSKAQHFVGVRRRTCDDPRLPREAKVPVARRSQHVGDWSLMVWPCVAYGCPWVHWQAAPEKKPAGDGFVSGATGMAGANLSVVYGLLPWGSWRTSGDLDTNIHVIAFISISYSDCIQLGRLIVHTNRRS